VNYSELPYLMLQAIRELKAENDSLKEVPTCGTASNDWREPAASDSSGSLTA